MVQKVFEELDGELEVINPSVCLREKYIREAAEAGIEVDFPFHIECKCDKCLREYG